MSPKTFVAIPLAAGLALAACEDRAEPVEEPAATPASEGETVSILRPDVESPIVADPIEQIDVTIGFPDGGSDLSDEAMGVMKRALESRAYQSGGKIILRGHSDAAGSDDANLRASQARAEAVRDWLMETGVAEDRIEVIAFGEQNPAEPNALPDGSPNETGRAANRRVDMTIMVPEGANDPTANEPSANEPVPGRDFAEEEEPSA